MTRGPGPGGGTPAAGRPAANNAPVHNPAVHNPAVHNPAVHNPAVHNTAVSNPPGLTQIAYRAGDFATFRRALLCPLPGEQQLAGWSPGPGDLGLQALEWWAYLADILTFYNERIANGSYLGTAVARPGPQNAAGLAALLGYLTTPAITATGVVAAIRGAGAQDGPLVIPAGLQIASTPTADAPAQLFEVTDGRTFTGPSEAVIGLPADPSLFSLFGPAVLPPVTVLPGPAQSGSGQLASDLSGWGQPGLVQSGPGQHGVGQPESGRPESGRSGSGEPRSGQQPGSGQSEWGEPGSGQPGSGQSGWGEPGSGQPGSGQSGGAQPGGAQPGGAQPGGAQPVGDDAEQRSVLLSGPVAATAGDQFVLLSRSWTGGTADWAVVTARSAVAEPGPDGRGNTRLTLGSADWRGLADPAAGPLAANYRLQRAPATALLWTMGAGAGGQLALPGSLAAPARPVQPARPAQPDLPVPPAPPAQLALPAQSAQPAQPATSAQPATPAQSARRTQPTGPASPALPALPASPALPVGHPPAATPPAATPPAATPSDPTPPAGPAPQTLTVPMATLVRGVSPGDNVLFTGSTGGPAPQVIQLLAQVTSGTEEVTRVPAAGAAAAGSRSGTPPPDVFISHTNLTVRTTGADNEVAALRSALGTPALGGVVLRYGFRDVGTLIPTPAAALRRLPVTVTVPPGLRPPPGPVALQDANGAGLLVTAAVGAPGTVTLTPADGGAGLLSPALAAPVRLLTNLVPVSRGTTVATETLGDGDPAAASQAFTLQQAPLVYLPPAEPGGDPVSTLSVSVNGVPWHEVRTLAGQPSGARVYVVSRLPDDTVQVQFGDGVSGARLPLGTGNVTASYRYGAAAPPPPAGSLATVLQPQPNLGSVRNPADILPGTGPETAGETAATAPATVVLLPGVSSASPPLISLGDSERLAATVDGVTRVRAYWTWDPELRRPAITVYVGGDVGGDPVADAVVAAVGRLFPAGAARMALRAAAARSVGLAVDCRLLGAPGVSADAVRASATEALTGAGGLFSPGQMGIGQRLYRSQVEAALTAGGRAAVLSLSVRRPVTEGARGAGTEGAGTDGAGTGGEPLLDPGQDGYFSLASADLAVSVVPR